MYVIIAVILARTVKKHEGQKYLDIRHSCGKINVDFESMFFVFGLGLKSLQGDKSMYKSKGGY